MNALAPVEAAQPLPGTGDYSHAPSTIVTQRHWHIFHVYFV